MSQSVYQFSTEQIEKMKQHYKASLKPNPPQSASFSAKVNGCTITAYKSGKVLFQGGQYEQEASKWTGGKTTTKKGSTQRKQKPLPSFLNENHIGTDEAGSGDYFGPMTAAAAYVTNENRPLLERIGVRDSKNLRDDDVIRIAKDLVKANIPYSLVVLRNEKYNEWQKRGWSQGKMKAILHYQVIKKVREKMNSAKDAGIVVDQFAQPAVFERYLKSEGLPIPKHIHYLTKAESHSIAVAAGSILARAKFLSEMDKLSAATGITLQKGASHLVDQQAAFFLKEKGEDFMTTCAKVHFANTEKAKRLM
ncbi:ribonuclease HIII [Salirhabdus salicampi]|uniref:ribonuclease HIII n=1 Tax=Salirhabdus salicampi TaxID=476102 RepID=UPI0020C3717D|nr:ribonuclease HIII [Salirhabdus salicampi]MCP8617063.1 ribonuclease HIII [Salirhabdus salicampi]